MKKLFLLSILFAFCTLNASNFDQAIYEYKKENFTKALTLFNDSCSHGNKQSCYDLAVMYKYGQGIRANRHKADKLFLKACGKTSGCRYVELSKS